MQILPFLMRYKRRSAPGKSRRAPLPENLVRLLDVWLYTLTLDTSVREAIAYAAAPEICTLPVTFSSGSVQITVSGTQIKEINCSCTGGLEALAEAAPATVSAKIVFDYGSAFEVPSAVKDRLAQEGMVDHGE